MTTQGWMRALPDGKAISALGFGCSSLWAQPRFDADRARTILETAVAGGINHFDTSPSYGLGVGEQRLARFLMGRPPESVVVSTKVGNNLIDGAVERGFGRGLMERSLDSSLKRLGLERVDILYLHGPAKEDLNDETLRFFEDQKRAGRIGYSGVETASPAVLDALAATPIDVAMPHFNVGNLTLSGRVDRLRAAGKIVISGTVLAQSKFDLKTFVPTSPNALWYLLRMAKNDPLFWLHGPTLARRLRATGRNLHDAAIAFITGHPAVLSGLFGSSNPAHVASNARAGHEAMNDADRRTILRRAA